MIKLEREKAKGKKERGRTAFFVPLQDMQLLEIHQLRLILVYTPSLIIFL